MSLENRSGADLLSVGFRGFSVMDFFFSCRDIITLSGGGREACQPRFTQGVYGLAPPKTRATGVRNVPPIGLRQFP